jgi:hypothetical protein
MSRAVAYYAAQRVRQGNVSEARAVRPSGGSSSVEGPVGRSRRNPLARLFAGGVTSATPSHTALQGG